MIDLSAEVNYFQIYSENNSDFRVDDFAGPSTAFNISRGLINFSTTTTSSFTIYEIGLSKGLPFGVTLTPGKAYEHKFYEGVPLPGQYCFAEGTLVYTPTGFVNIEDLKIGDIVYGYCHMTNELKKCAVEANFSSNVQRLFMPLI